MHGQRLLRALLTWRFGPLALGLALGRGWQNQSHGRSRIGPARTGSREAGPEDTDRIPDESSSGRGVPTGEDSGVGLGRRRMFERQHRLLSGKSWLGCLWPRKGLHRHIGVHPSLKLIGSTSPLAKAGSQGRPSINGGKHSILVCSCSPVITARGSELLVYHFEHGGNVPEWCVAVLNMCCEAFQNR